MTGQAHVAGVLVVAGLVFSAGCLGAVVGTGGEGSPDESGRLELTNEDSEPATFEVYVNGTLRLNVTLEPGESLTKPGFVDEPGRPNVTVVARNTTSSSELIMTRSDGELYGPNVDAIINERGDLVVSVG